MADPSRNVAVFIDAENTGASHAKAIVAHSSTLGRIAFVRVYGKASELSSWEPAMKEHAIRSVPTPAAASKKNASDFALTIDAVRLLHDARYDHAVIVSKDGDFLQLVLHMKEYGARVTCIGESHASANLRKHCDGWISLSKEESKPAAAKAPKPKAAPAKPAAPIVPAKKPSTKAAKKAAAEPAQSQIDVAALKRHYEDYAAKHPGAVSRDAFITVLVDKMPGAKKGFRTWPKFLEESGLFEDGPGALKLKK